MGKRGIVFVLWMLFISQALLNCGGGGSSSAYTVGGTVSGLTGTLVLQNNGGDDLTITGNGAFTFTTELADGAVYDVTVLTPPAGQSCVITGGSGTIAGANITNVTAICSDSGTIDNSGFNSPFGYIAHNNAAGGDGDDYGRSVTVDSNGKVLVAGESINAAGNYDMVIWRYNSDGTPDTSGFNAPNGYVKHNSASGGNGYDSGYAVTLDSNGKVLVAGVSTSVGHNDMVIWRYDSDGTLDTAGFNSPDGFTAHDNAAGGVVASDAGSSIIVDSIGRILVAGSSEKVAGDKDMVIWRYNSDGTLDTAGFNPPNGFVVHSNAAGGTDVNDSGNSIALDSNGRILVTGSSETAIGADKKDMVIWRYNSDGTLDTAGFNSPDGFVVDGNTAGGTGNDIGSSIGLDSNGKILVAGSSKNAAGNTDMVIWRYNSDGTLDTTVFNPPDGFIFHDNAAGGNGVDAGLSIALDSNGLILVTGKSTNTSANSDMAIWRYHP